MVGIASHQSLEGGICLALIISTAVQQNCAQTEPAGHSTERLWGKQSICSWDSPAALPVPPMLVLESRGGRRRAVHAAPAAGSVFAVLCLSPPAGVGRDAAPRLPPRSLCTALPGSVVWPGPCLAPCGRARHFQQAGTGGGTAPGSRPPGCSRLTARAPSRMPAAERASHPRASEAEEQPAISWLDFGWRPARGSRSPRVVYHPQRTPRFPGWLWAVRRFRFGGFQQQRCPEGPG